MAAKAAPFLIAALVVLLDQITKLLIRSNVLLSETIPVIPGFFNIVHAENPGVAFSLFADTTGAWRSIVLIGLSAVAVAFLAFLLLSNVSAQNSLLRTSLALIMGGAFGNLVDRFFHQTVTDFVEVYASHYYFPAFNVADSCITVGAALLFIDMWRARRSPQHAS